MAEPQETPAQLADSGPSELSKTRLLAVLGIVGISFSAIFIRLAAVSPSTAAFFRSTYALPILAIAWWWSRRDDRRAPALHLKALAAGVFLGIDFAFWHRAIELIGAGLATVLGNAQVIFVGLAAWALHRERPTLAALAALPVVLIGVTLISGLGLEGAYGVNPTLGVAFGVFTALTYAAFLLLMRASNPDLVPPAGPLFEATLAASITSIAIGFIDGGLDYAFHWPAHGWLLALALVSQSVGWLLITRCLPRLPALETSVLLLLQPMLTVLWAWLLFGEDLSVLQWLGVLLVLGGVGVLSIRGSVQKAEAT